jgi:F0F1-type ATP synthase assembly protein I
MKTRLGAIFKLMFETVFQTSAWRLLLLLLLLLTAIELSVGGSSPYVNTDKANENKYT